MTNEQHTPHDQSDSTPELEQQVLAAVLRGVPSLRLVSAQKLADEYAARHTSPDAAVDELIRDSATWNFTTGFMTGLGGVITMAVAIPAALMSSLAMVLGYIRALDAALASEADGTFAILDRPVFHTEPFERAAALPKPVLEEIARVATMSNWTLVDFWNDALAEQERGTFVTSLGARMPKQLAGARRTTLTKTLAAVDARPIKPKEETLPLDVDKVADLLAADGPFAQQFPGYEPREPQTAMLRKVAQTFNEGGIEIGRAHV